MKERDLLGEGVNSMVGRWVRGQSDHYYLLCTCVELSKNKFTLEIPRTKTI